MATKKFDLIAQEFVDGIGARFSSAFTPGGGAMPGTNIITAAQISAYVNKALNNYFETYWKEAEGDLVALINFFPELVVEPVEIAFTSGKYSIANPHLNLFKLFGATSKADNKFISILPTHLWAKVESGLFPMYDFDGDRPAMIQTNSRLYVYPTTITAAYITYVKLPKNGTNGELLTQNGLVDSPFLETRHSDIVTIAKNLYLADTTKTGGQ